MGVTTMGDPTNAEIKTLLEQHMAASQTARVEAAKDNAAMSQQLVEMRGEVRAQGVKLLEIDRRTSKAEMEIKRLKEEHDGLQGHLLAEVGALAHNDKAQNSALASIKLETHAQTKTLGELASANDKREAREQTIYFVLTKGLPLLFTALFGLGGAIVWVATHWK